MTVDEFWQLIEEKRIESNGDTKLQVELLVDALTAMPLETILDYYRLYQQLLKRADRGSLYDAAYVLQEGCGSDGFTDFRAWLIAQGKQIYENALKEPDTLADYVTLDDRYETSAEAINYVASYAYHNQTDSKEYEYLPPVKVDDAKFAKDDGYYGCMYVNKDNPSTEPLDDCIKRRYPKLWAKFGW